ncbi:phage baseplate protein [Leminorella grimontii]|uniref:phage baseplate protein n=1 Tax=Leminorella grimontii TaxID=82981 RepID=UPI003220030B
MSSVWGILTKLLSSPSGVVGFQGDSVNMEFDVVTNESHTWTADVTSNPVETGVMVADHVQVKPDSLEISGVISNSTIERWRGKFVESILELLNSESNVQKAFDQLRQLLDDRQPVIVYTKYRTYPDMVLTRLSIPRKVGEGDSIEFSATFTHIRRVSTLVVDAEEAGINPKQSDSPETERKSSPKKNKGPTYPSTADSDTTVYVENKTTTTIENSIEIEINADK